MPAEPTVLFEDHHLLILNKPAPLLTQAPDGVPSLEAWAKSYLKEKYNKPAGVYLGIPHRLDRPVSGVVVFCRNTKAAQRVHLQFQERTVQKVYWALVQESPDSHSGTWEDWIRKLQDESRIERVEPHSEGAKRAALRFKMLHQFEETSLLELHPETGRMHQLRAQCAWRGHAILGDTHYGSSRPFGPVAELPRDSVIALHARQLTLQHPFQREPIIVQAALPEYWPTLPLPLSIS